MGTSGAYSGSGGKFGDMIRDEVDEWITALPSGGPQTETPASPDPPEVGERPTSPPPPRLDPTALLPVLNLLRPRGSGGGGADGPGGGSAGDGYSGGGRRGGGPTRSVVGSAGTAGRAAAGAYAYRTGDSATLDRLGLSYADLSALGDPIEVARRVVDAACGRTDSTIEDHEQRLIAADIAEWVLTENPAGSPPDPEDIVRYTIARIIGDTVLSESGEIINNSDHAGVAEQEVRDAAEALAARAELSSTGASETEFADAIERGIETLRAIVEAGR